MATNNDEFLKKLLATFRVEADEHIQAMSSGLVELEKMPAGEQQSESVERIYREAHSLKGAARAVNLADMESVCHALESVFAGLKSNRVATTPPLFDLLHQALEALRTLLAAAGQTKSGMQKEAVAPLIRRLEDALIGAAPVIQETGPAMSAAAAEPAMSADPAATPRDSDRGTETIRVRTAKLDSVMRQTEELLAPRLAAGERARELRALGTTLGAWKNALAKVRPAMRAVERSFARKTNGAAMAQRELTKLLEYLDA
ncbi:MAG TPA: Hpt domain-containing protein, partial [Burkholderiales bacterium]|nr:Hpt domain-containing protein [Burkholderiales bacterium]